MATALWPLPSFAPATAHCSLPREARPTPERDPRQKAGPPRARGGHAHDAQDQRAAAGAESEDGTGTGKPPGIATAFVAVSFAGSKRSSTAVEAGAGVEPSKRTPESYQLSTMVTRATERDGTSGCTTSAELTAKRAVKRLSFIGDRAAISARNPREPRASS